MFTAFLKRAAANIGAVLAWVYTILDFALDWIGRSTADDDAAQLVKDKLPAWADWLFSTPSWVPALCAIGLTAWLIWLSRPQASPVQSAPDSPPRERLAADLAAQPQPTQAGTAATPPAPSRFPAGLYVGQMHMDLSRLADERHMSVSFSLFNGAGEPIFLSGIGGSITYREVKEGGATRIGELPPPMLENTQGQRMEGQPFKEYLVTIYQRVPADTADRIGRLLEGGGEAHFDFDKLTVSAALCANPADTGRIRLWDGASLSKRPDSYACGRIIDSNAEIRANLGVSV